MFCRNFEGHLFEVRIRLTNGGGRTEDFGWDGLALVRRGDERFVNEPHPGGGSPVISSKGVTYLNDMLGTTVGAKRGARYSAAALTAFGEGGGRHAFFTGKPLVEGLGRAFLMRNYRADLAKWQTADPLGYPDGWDPLAYCGNRVTDTVDLWGCKKYKYASFFFSKIDTEWVVIPADTPVDIGSIEPSAKKVLFDWLIERGTEELIDIAKEIMLPLWTLYKAYGHGVRDSTQAEIEEQIADRGFDSEYEFVDCSFFSSRAEYSISEDIELGEGIFIDKMFTTWKVVMRKVIE